MEWDIPCKCFRCGRNISNLPAAYVDVVIRPPFIDEHGVPVIGRREQRDPTILICLDCYRDMWKLLEERP